MDFRFDQLGHWPVTGPKRLCKFENCAMGNIGIKTEFIAVNVRLPYV